ncbi:hypothetical protein BDV3_005869 [Batrachochytrium dendrobatidis]
MLSRIWRLTLRPINSNSLVSAHYKSLVSANYFKMTWTAPFSIFSMWSGTTAEKPIQDAQDAQNSSIAKSNDKISHLDCTRPSSTHSSESSDSSIELTKLQDTSVLQSDPLVDSTHDQHNKDDVKEGVLSAIPDKLDDDLLQSIDKAAKQLPSSQSISHPESNQAQDDHKHHSTSTPDLSILRKPRVFFSSRNRVLPSYEEELEADNTVVRESNPRWFYMRTLHWLNSWYHTIMGHTDEPRSSGILTSAIDRLTRTPYDIERVAIIGVHGWFPGRLLQRVVGEPTGTSTHFAQKMAFACKNFFYDRYGINLPLDNMTVIPLEGEGKVKDRVELLYDQLTDPAKKWIDAIRSADLVLVSAHSQGTPVATMLVARLIEQGILDPRKQRTGILAMAGISHGPYPTLKSSLIVKYVESDPARQLFEFNDPDSSISREYYQAAYKVLSAGARFIAVGSWYDQAVPLYSATLHGLHHPNIYRALYIDAADYQPDFLSHLVVFALKLRNAGLLDHGLIVYLSDVLAGNIYGFGTQGHYAIYEEENTYTVAVAWTMGTRQNWSRPALGHLSSSAQPFGIDSSSIRLFQPPKQQQIQSESLKDCDASTLTTPTSYESILLSPPFQAPQKINPYHLPWIMAKLTSDPKIAANAKLSSDLDNIIVLFDSWDVGSSRSLKDVKYRLEPLKSKL